MDERVVNQKMKNSEEVMGEGRK